MKGSDATKDILVLDSLPNDSLYHDIQFPFTQPVYKAEALRTHYIVVSESPKWLYMIYNDVVIMRYRLKIKKSDR